MHYCSFVLYFPPQEYGQCSGLYCVMPKVKTKFFLLFPYICDLTLSGNKAFTIDIKLRSLSLDHPEFEVNPKSSVAASNKRVLEMGIKVILK